MAHSHKPIVLDILRFFMGYFVVSALLTFILIGISYRDVLSLRFNSSFYNSSTNYSSNVNNLAAEGFTKNALSAFNDKLPAIVLVVALLIVAYSTYSAYQGVYHYIKVSKLYMNSRKESVSLITLRYGSLSILFFVVPLLYWCYLIAVWYPIFIKIPLHRLAASNVMPFVILVILVLITLSILTHIGIVMTRLAAKTYKHIMRG